MARHTQKSSHTVAVVRGEKVVAPTPPTNRIATIAPQTLVAIAAAAQAKGAQAKRDCLKAMVAQGMIVPECGVGAEKAPDMVQRLTIEAKARDPQAWAAAKAALVPVTQVKGEIPSPEVVSQIAAEAASQVEPEMPSEPTETKTPEKGEEESVMSDIEAEEFPREQLLGKKGKPLTGGALKARLVSLRAKKAKDAEAVVAKPVETKEEVPVTEVQPTDEAPDGPLADQVRALLVKAAAPVEAPKVEAKETVQPLFYLPQVLAKLAKEKEYADIGYSSGLDEVISEYVAGLKLKAGWTSGMVLAMVAKHLRNAKKETEEAEKAKKASYERDIRAFARTTFEEAKMAVLDNHTKAEWKGDEPNFSFARVQVVVNTILDKRPSIEEAQKEIRAAIARDFASWMKAVEVGSVEAKSDAQSLEATLRALTPQQVQLVLRGVNSRASILHNWLALLLKGKAPEINPGVYRQALANADSLKAVLDTIRAAWSEAQKEAAAQAEVTRKAGLEAARAKKGVEVDEALGQYFGEVVPEPVQEPQEPKVIEPVTEEAQEAPKAEEVVPESVQQPVEAEATETVVEVPEAEETAPPTEEVIPPAPEEPQAETVQPDVETLSGLRKLNAFFKRQSEKLAAKRDQFVGWVAKKEPKKPTPRALRRETQDMLDELLSMNPEEGALFEIKEGSRLAVTIQKAFEQYVSGVDDAKAKKAAALGFKKGTKVSLTNAEYPKPVLVSELAWALKIALILWHKKGGLLTEEDILKSFQRIKGLPGREVSFLGHIVNPLMSQVQTWSWDADQLRVLHALQAAKEVSKADIKDGSYMKHYSYHTAVFLAKGLFGFASWAKLPFRAALQLVGGTTWALISSKKGEKGAGAKKALKGAWHKVQQFGWYIPKEMVTKAWTKVSKVFRKKAKTEQQVQKEALETKGAWGRAVESVAHLFGKVAEATTKVVEAGKADKAKPIGAAIGAVAAGAAAIVLGMPVAVTVAAVAIGAALGWFAKRAIGFSWGWLKGKFGKKADASAPAAEAATVSA